MPCLILRMRLRKTMFDWGVVSERSSLSGGRSVSFVSSGPRGEESIAKYLFVPEAGDFKKMFLHAKFLLNDATVVTEIV